MFSCSSLNICWIIILNSLLDNSWISIFLGPVIEVLLYAFDGNMVPWFFIIPITIHKCLHIWRSNHFFQTLWTEFTKGSLSSEGGSTLDDIVTFALVVQDAKCDSIWQHQVWGSLTSLHLRTLGSTVSKLCGPWWANQGICSDCKGCWDPKWHLQLCYLGIMVSSGGARAGGVHTLGYRVPAASIYIMGPVSDILIVMEARADSKVWEQL